MKKSSGLPFLLTLAFPLSAQLPQGAVAPDFTAPDINGQTWHLYELLEQGKVVVLEISATWCPPCWAYHNSHALQDFYEAHGPEGDGKAQVFFVEGDPETNTECLYDEPDCNVFTPGNWVTGTTYPYLNNAAVADSFLVSYFPTIFVICPNKKTYQIGQFNADELWEKVRGCPVAFGVNNAGIFEHSTGSPMRDVCDTLNVLPSFKLVNLGSSPLTAATVNLLWNNNLEQTKQWQGYLPLYDEVPITFDSLPLDGPGTMKTTVTSVNGGAGDDDYSNNVYNEQFALAKTFSTQQITLKIKTDNFGIETYWEVRDEQGNTLFHGGNTAVGPNGGGIYGEVPLGPGTYGSNVLISKTLTLPGDGCYSILFVDAYGDGLCCNYGYGYFKLYNNSNLAVPIISGGEFGAVVQLGFQVDATTADFSPAENFADLRLFPNPVGDWLQLDFDLAENAVVSVSITNTLGQIVDVLAPEQLSPGEYARSVPTAAWPKGVYFVRFQVGEQIVVRMVVVGG